MAAKKSTTGWKTPEPVALPLGALAVDSSGEVEICALTTAPATLAGLRMHRSDDWHRVAVTTPEPILAAAAAFIAELIDDAAALQGATDLRGFAACMGDEDGDRFPVALRAALELETRMAEVPTIEDMAADPETDWTLRERKIWEHMGALQHEISGHENRRTRIQDLEDEGIALRGRIKELQNLLYEHGIKYV